MPAAGIIGMRTPIDVSRLSSGVYGSVAVQVGVNSVPLCACSDVYVSVVVDVVVDEFGRGRYRLRLYCGTVGRVAC